MAKVSNPLRSGLGSRILALCFSSPKSAWDIAKIHYENKNPRAARIYVEVKKLNGTYLEKSKDDKYRTLTEPLVREFKEILKEKNEPLTLNEAKMLTTILDSTRFRSGIAALYNRELLTEKRKDIVSILNESLARDSTIFMLRRQNGLSKDPSLGAGSDSQFLVWFNGRMAEIEKGTFSVKLPFGFKENFERTIDALRKMLGSFADIPRGQKEDYEEFEQTILKAAWYSIIYELLPSKLLAKLALIDEQGKEIGIMSYIFGGFQR